MPFLSQPFSLVLIALLQAASASPAPQVPEKAPLAWASVSIHESNPNKQDNFSNDQANGINEQGMSLREIISQGYNFSVMPFREEEIAGLPEWAKSARYDIQARVDPDDVATFKKLSDMPMQELVADFAARKPTGEMLMVQALLDERFHLRVHWEWKDRGVYVLSVAKGGVRIKPAADPKHGSMSFSQGHMDGKGVPVSFLATLLELPAERTIVDKTGLDGVYDFDLRFAPRDNPGGTASNDPDFFTAVQEQLGLKLQSTHASVPVLVVDHVEPPTPN